ncbi:DNA-binding protein [Candidatus Woesearchaeota archaeon]|nr:DNA-binding protein [Candidatus Woesearchaeota archaeon]
MKEDLNKRLELQRQIALIEESAKKYLDRDALQRLGNLKSAYPEKALQVSALILQNAEAGNLKRMLNDEQLKQLLISLDEPKREFKFTRK